MSLSVQIIKCQKSGNIVLIWLLFFVSWHLRSSALLRVFSYDLSSNDGRPQKPSCGSIIIFFCLPSPLPALYPPPPPTRACSSEQYKLHAHGINWVHSGADKEVSRWLNSKWWMSRKINMSSVPPVPLARWLCCDSAPLRGATALVWATGVYYWYQMRRNTCQDAFVEMEVA